MPPVTIRYKNRGDNFKGLFVYVGEHSWEGPYAAVADAERAVERVEGAMQFVVLPPVVCDWLARYLEDGKESDPVYAEMVVAALDVDRRPARLRGAAG